MVNIEVEEVKKLIKQGFDLELMSFELEIPIEKLKQYKIEIEGESKKTKTHNNRKITENQKAHSKAEKIRERYRKLFNSSNEVKVKSQKKLTPKELGLINSVTIEIEKIVEKMKGLSNEKKAKTEKGIEEGKEERQERIKERQRQARKILDKLNQIIEYPLNIEQAERLHILMHSPELDALYLSRTDTIDSVVGKSRQKIT